jgi:uncharacterized membrane protein
MPDGRSHRLDSIDLLRGLAMIAMALDHVRDFFSNAHFEPMDVEKTNAGYYLTRIVTHFCAPIFVFLAGTGAFMQLGRGKTKGALASFLVTRGLWLILLEVTVVRFGWAFNLDYHFFAFQVIWALGCSMIFLAPLIYLPPRVTAAIGIGIVLTHNLFDGVRVQSFDAAGTIWRILHQGGPFPLPGGRRLMIAYPLVPWIGVMAAGFGFGALLKVDTDERDRRARLVRLGSSLFVLFVLLRLINVYGDAHPWKQYGSFGQSLGAFFDCQKYPPSLDYCLMTLGPAIALLAPLEKFRGKLANAVLVFGRVPLFYYLLHLIFIHALVVLLAWTHYGHVMWETFNLPFIWKMPSDYGYSLPIVYVLWAVVVVGLFPLCRWFAGVKSRNKSAWLSYL